MPVPKIKDCRTKSMTCDDYRGTTVSKVSRVVLYIEQIQRLSSQLRCSIWVQKGYGCRNAIYSVRKITDRLIKGGSTVNTCAIDLSKAFDKVNHSASYVKLMKRLIPTELLELLENWLSDCFAYVKWNDSWSNVQGWPKNRTVFESL